MTVLGAWRRTTSRCVYCGSHLMAHVPDLRQRCPNDCASGLGRAPADRLFAQMRGTALEGRSCSRVAIPTRRVDADALHGELLAIGSLEDSEHADRPERGRT